MSSSHPIGASTPLFPSLPSDAADSADDTTFYGDDLKDFTPQLPNEKEPPYCPGAGEYMPHRAGLLHPLLNGTQVGSEG